MTEYYNDLCNLLIRPTRQKYHLYDLGNPIISGHGKRIDFQILSSLNLKLKCSYYYLTQQKLPSPVVLYLHSFNGSRLQSIAYVQALMQKGFNVLSFDFAGCGISQGDYVTLGSRQKDDVLTLIRYMHRKFYCKQFAIWGRSMGAVTAIKVCKLLQDQKQKSNQLRQISIISLILDSPFISLNRLAVEIAKQKISAPQILIKVIFMMMKSTIQDKAHFDINSLQLTQDLKSIKFPTLILCSKKDSLISCKHSQQIYQLIKNSPQKELVYMQSEHNQSRKESDLNKVYEFLINQHQKYKNYYLKQVNNAFLSNNHNNKIINRENEFIQRGDFYKSQSIDRSKLVHNGSCKDTFIVPKNQSSFSKVVNINELLAQKKSKSINKQITNKNTIVNLNGDEGKNQNANDINNLNNNHHLFKSQEKQHKSYNHNNTFQKHIVNSSNKLNINIQNLQENQNNQINYWSNNIYNKNKQDFLKENINFPMKSTSTRNLQSQKQVTNQQNDAYQIKCQKYSSKPMNECQNKKVFFSSSIVDSNNHSQNHTHKNIRLMTESEQKQQKQEINKRNNRSNQNYCYYVNNSSKNMPGQTPFRNFLASIPEAHSVEKTLKNTSSIKNINKSSIKSSKKLIKISTDQQDYNKMNIIRFQDRQNQDVQEVQVQELATRQQECKQHLNVITAKLKKKKSTKKGLTKSFLPFDKLQFNKNNKKAPNSNENQNKNVHHFFNSNSNQNSTICSPSYQYQTGQSSIQNRINNFNQQNFQLQSKNQNRNQQNIMLISSNTNNHASLFNKNKFNQNDSNTTKNNQFQLSSTTVTPTYQSSKNLQNKDKGLISITSQKIMQNQKQKQKQKQHSSIKQSSTVFFSSSNLKINNNLNDNNATEHNQRNFIQRTLNQNNQHRPIIFKPQTPQTSNIVRSHSRRSSVDLIQFNTSVNSSLKASQHLNANVNVNVNNANANINSNTSFTSISTNSKRNGLQTNNINKHNNDQNHNNHNFDKLNERPIQKQITFPLSNEVQSKINTNIHKNYKNCPIPRQNNPHYSSSKNIKLVGSLLVQKQFVPTSLSKKSIEQHFVNNNIGKQHQDEDKKKFIIARRCQNNNYLNTNSKQNSLINNQINTSLDQYANNHLTTQASQSTIVNLNYGDMNE